MSLHQHEEVDGLDKTDGKRRQFSKRSVPTSPTEERQPNTNNRQTIYMDSILTRKNIEHEHICLFGV